jgi:hypothetical protein
MNKTETKRCPQCERDLPLSKEYFFRNKAALDGYDGWCKKCKMEADRRSYRNARLDRPRFTRGSKYSQRPRHFNGIKKHWEICMKCGRQFLTFGHRTCRRCTKENYYAGYNFSGNNEALIYFDIDGTSYLFKTEQVKKAQALANESGNPKVWTARECSQDFLRSLIPSRQ